MRTQADDERRDVFLGRPVLAVCASGGPSDAIQVVREEREATSSSS
jgi:hypothetical protein